MTIGFPYNRVFLQHTQSFADECMNDFQHLMLCYHFAWLCEWYNKLSDINILCSQNYQVIRKALLLQGLEAKGQSKLEHSTYMHKNRMYTILQIFTQVSFLTGKHGNHENCVPSMPSHYLSLIFMVMKYEKKRKKWWIPESLVKNK